MLKAVLTCLLVVKAVISAPATAYNRNQPVIKEPFPSIYTQIRWRSFPHPLYCDFVKNGESHNLIVGMDAFQHMWEHPDGSIPAGQLGDYISTANLGPHIGKKTEFAWSLKFKIEKMHDGMTNQLVYTDWVNNFVCQTCFVVES